METTINRMYASKSASEITDTLVEVTEEQAIELFNMGAEIWKEDFEPTWNDDEDEEQYLKAMYSLGQEDTVEDITGTGCKLFVEKSELSNL